MPDPGFTCATCPAFSSEDDKGGLCRLRPPSVHVVPGQIVGQLRPVNLWPAVARTDWCWSHPAATTLWQPLAMPIDSRLASEAQGEA
jgi:hypothetical protein